MEKLNDIPDTTAKLEILKLLLANVVNNPEIISIMQGQIDKLEKIDKDGGEKSGINSPSKKSEEEPLPDFEQEDNSSEEENTPENISGLNIQPTTNETEEKPTENTETNTEKTNEYIPSPAELNVDMTKATK